MVKVKVSTDHNSYRLRWSYNKKRYSLAIGSISEASLRAANAKAKLIESDILFDRFDTSLTKYSLKPQTQPDTILTIWKRYKSLNSRRVALTTQKECWTQVDRCLAKVPQTLLALDKADELVRELLKHYSPATLKRVLIDINAAAGNYYKLTKLPKTSKQPIECFNNGEVKAIIEAFASNRYQSAYSQYAHDYYTDYVSFLAYTGCRPSEAIALTYSDISSNIRFDKAYSKGILKATKTHKIRDFPINEQLAEALGSGVGLVFPSVCGGYINHKVWTKRYWRPVVSGLVSEGKVRKYLKCYCLRHSGITRLIRSGYDIATVAKLAGTSPEMIMRNYLAAHDTSELVLPEL